MARSLKDKLYLSGMDGQAAALARQWHVGYEITAFSYAPMLDAPETAERVRRDMAGVERFWLHAPFAELSPCAIDPLVRQVVEKRLLQAAETASSLGVTRMVCHGGFIPHVYFPVAPMSPWLRHVHLHNNEGDTDLHQPLGEGSIPMEAVLDAVLREAPEATFTIENQDCLPSLVWLAEKGYIEEHT